MITLTKILREALKKNGTFDPYQGKRNFETAAY